MWTSLNGPLCSVFACRQPFPAGDRVTFNGKECVCQKCTQPLPANSPAPIQAVHSQCPAARVSSPAQHPSHTQGQKKIFHSATLSSGLLPSAQTAAAAGRSSRMSSPSWRWTSTGTWAASSAEFATRCSTPSTSASKYGVKWHQSDKSVDVSQGEEGSTASCFLWTDPCVLPQGWNPLL